MGVKVMSISSSPVFATSSLGTPFFWVLRGDKEG